MMKVNWLKQEAKDGKFKGLEIELARTIMEIMKGTAGNSIIEDVWFQKKGNYSDDMEVISSTEGRM